MMNDVSKVHDSERIKRYDVVLQINKFGKINKQFMARDERDLFDVIRQYCSEMGYIRNDVQVLVWAENSYQRSGQMSVLGAGKDWVKY